MKLLFDENLSPKLPRLLDNWFSGSLHLRDCSLKGATDEAVWEYARDNEFTIVSKDSDFYQRGLLYGYPPKFVWLRIGNCTRESLVTLLITHAEDIRAFCADLVESILVLS
jgi:predicted nuclease of predicted toxin-antitoxin system